VLGSGIELDPNLRVDCARAFPGRLPGVRSNEIAIGPTTTRSGGAAHGKVDAATVHIVEIAPGR
jgi:hypothetical protein